jgi:hypothetical protein
MKVTKMYLINKAEDYPEVVDCENFRYVDGIFLTRDSDALEKANWHCFNERMGRLGIDVWNDVAIEECRSWTTGWVKFVLVRRATFAESIVHNIERELNDYPCLDDMIMSHYEVGYY